MSVQETRYDDVMVLTVKGELGAEECPLLRTAAERLLAGNQRDFVVDLGQTGGADSAGLETLTWLRREAEDRLGLVKLAAPDPTVRKILEMTRLDRQFEVFDDLEPAIQSFA